MLRFTKTSVAAIPPAPAGKRVSYTDDEQDGLVLRVTDKGTKTYSVFARLKGGNPERITIGPSTKVTPDEARAKAKQIIAALARGESHVAASKALRAESTMDELMGEYLARVPMKARSKAEAERLRANYIKPGLGQLQMSKVTQKLVAKLHSDITLGKVKGLRGGAVTANRTLANIKAAFNWAAGAGLWDAPNPAAKIPKNEERSRERHVEPHELAKFFTAVAASPEPSRSFFLLAVLTGARRSNVAGMRWQDIDIDAAIWTVPGESSKNGDPLRVTLVPEAVEVLIDRKAAAGESDFVLPGRGKSGHYEEPKRAWSTVRKRAGMPDLTIHDLRRTLGSWLVRTGASTAINMKALGHKSMQAASVYQRIADTDPMRGAMEKATSAILVGAGLKAPATTTRARRKA